MTYAVRFLPQVETDVWNGRTWYEGKAPGLGEEFLRVFYACSEELARDPQIYPKVHRDFRRRLLRRFPVGGRRKDGRDFRDGKGRGSRLNY